MANFSINLVNPDTLAVDIVNDGGVLVITDHSNYDDLAPEAGHEQSDFDLFYKVIIERPDYTSYIFSSIGDGDEAITVPADAAELPLELRYTYPTGDGIYYITIQAVPTWNETAEYLAETEPVVYFAGKFWQALQDSTGIMPSPTAEQWNEIEELTSKYSHRTRIVITRDMQILFARKLYNALIVNSKVKCRWDDLVRDRDYIDAMRLSLALSGIPVLMEYQNWIEVEKTVNYTKSIK